MSTPNKAIKQYHRQNITFKDTCRGKCILAWLETLWQSQNKEGRTKFTLLSYKHTCYLTYNLLFCPVFIIIGTLLSQKSNQLSNTVIDKKEKLYKALNIYKNINSSNNH